MDDYSSGCGFRSRSAELQDIAAMDRLAGRLAPASALHRYVEGRVVRPTPSWTQRVKALLHHDRHPAAPRV